MRTYRKQSVFDDPIIPGTWKASLRKYQVLPSYGNPGTRVQIAGRLSQDPPGALKWDRNAFAAELTTASGGSEETGQSPESGGKRSETSTDTAVSAKSVSLNPDTGSRRDIPATTDLSELSQRIDEALKRCDTFSETFTFNSPDVVVPSGTSISMRSAVACLRNGQPPNAEKPRNKALPSFTEESIPEAVKRKAIELDDAVNTMRRQMVDLNKGYIQCDVLDRVSLAAPEISPFVDGVQLRCKRLMQDIDAIDRGTLTCRQLLQSGIRQKRQELQQMLQR